MHQFAAGSAGSVGLAGSEPPLSTETIGRPPSNYELVPLHSVPRENADPQVEEQPDGPVESPVQMPVLLPVRPQATERRRVVVRLVGDQELDLGTFDERGEAVERAKQMIATLTTAESAGEWPELDGRYLRPASILSVDILVAGS